MTYRASTVRLRNGAILAVGPRPPMGSAVARGGFHMLVLSAESYQPPASRFPGVHVLHVPLNDDGRPMTNAERAAARRAAGIVVRELARGHHVLVTCEQGRNRSALVAAIALVLTGQQRPRAIATLRRMRTNALTNQDFERMLQREDLTG